jgi:hypothetical protein
MLMSDAVRRAGVVRHTRSHDRTQEPDVENADSLSATGGSGSTRPNLALTRCERITRYAHAFADAKDVSNEYHTELTPRALNLMWAW